jgi:hypothetical protein
LQLGLHFHNDRFVTLRNIVDQEKAALERRVIDAGLMPKVNEAARQLTDLLKVRNRWEGDLEERRDELEQAWAVYRRGKTKKLLSHESLNAVGAGIAASLGVFSSEEVRTIGNSTQWHDVGKRAVTDQTDGEIKSEKYVGADRFEAGITLHPISGMMILERVPDYAETDVPYIVLIHHVRMNKTGYPIILDPRDIPVEALIAAAVDTYHAIMEKRDYICGKSDDCPFDDDKMYEITMNELWRSATPPEGIILPYGWTLSPGEELPDRCKARDYDRDLLLEFNKYVLDTEKAELGENAFKKNVKERIIRNTKRGTLLPAGTDKAWYDMVMQSDSEEVLRDAYLFIRTQPEYQFPPVLIGVLEYVIERHPDLKKVGKKLES